MWSYNYHQIAGAEWALNTIRKYGWAYMCWQERTRKTGAALLTVENSTVKSCLIVTKKNAIPGWEEHFKNLPLTKRYRVINYESVHKVVGKFDFIILDEAHHAISGVPKPSKTWRAVKMLCVKKPILYLSATPYAEHLGLIFHQLALSSWTPFKFKNFYGFHRKYGIPDMAYTPVPRETYKKYKDKEILEKIAPMFSFKTRAEVGIEHEPTVNVIEVPLEQYTKDLINGWAKTKLLTAMGQPTIPNDSPGKDRAVHYQLEGGTAKGVGVLECHEKVDYIKDNYDPNKIAIMAHFVLEREILQLHFPTVRILSSDGHAEGVDLSDVEKLIVYSMSFKTSKHTQRIARQANHDRKIPIEVDVLVGSSPGIGRYVYDTVAVKKENFIKNSYEQALKETK